MPTSSLLAIGNELLNGDIRDLNLHTLSQKLTQLGFTVTQAVICRDDPLQIADALRYLLERHPDVLICSGGLGPTQDDLTLEALAQALGRTLSATAAARAMVEAHYDQLIARGHLLHRGPEIARQKMATLPEGATPLANPIGTAPGVRLMVGATAIYVLPGVPAELQAIFDQSIAPELREHYELGVWFEDGLRVHCDDEAEVALPLQLVRARHPHVYLKSLAQPFPAASREGLRIIGAARAPELSQARVAVATALADLRRAVEAVGLPVTALAESDDREQDTP